MSKLKVSELFFSLQGEGLHAGVPSVFLRTFGCNKTCAGFGMPRGQLSEERNSIDPKKYEKYSDIPLVSTGCDSFPAWDPRFKHLSPMRTVDQIVEDIRKLLPRGKFDINTHLVLTGGEPLLIGWQKVYPELLSKLSAELGLEFITFETNGTVELVQEFSEYLRYSDFDITFAVSSKLPCSGETWESSIIPRVAAQYYCYSHNMFFKWVVSKEEDVEDVKRAIKEYSRYLDMVNDVPVYLMPVGGTTESYFLNNVTVAEIAKKNGWRYSPRLQVDLYKNSWGS